MKKILVAIAFFLTFLGGGLIYQPALAVDLTPPICQQHPNAAGCAKAGSENPANHVLKVAADIIAIMTGIAAVILIIAGGFGMITSGGNTEAATNARKRITSAVIGLVIVALAWTIITFAIDKLLP